MKKGTTVGVLSSCISSISTTLSTLVSVVEELVVTGTTIVRGTVGTALIVVGGAVEIAVNLFVSKFDRSRRTRGEKKSLGAPN
jgi:hypothetical protein